MTEIEAPPFVEGPPPPTPDQKYQAQLEAGMAADRAREAARLAAPARRPSGSGLIILGLVLLGGGALMAGIGMFMSSVYEPSAVDRLLGQGPTANDWKAPLIWGGGGLLQLGLVLWLAGTIVRAIFFLPGREVSVGDLSA